MPEEAAGMKWVCVNEISHFRDVFVNSRTSKSSATRSKNVKILERTNHLHHPAFQHHLIRFHVLSFSIEPQNTQNQRR